MDALSQPDTDREILRQYYKEYDTFSSIDGILKIFSVISCGVCSVLHVGGGTCGSQPLALGGAGAAIVGAFLVAALSAGSTCSLRTRAPLAWLYTDLVVSTVVGGVLLVSAMLMFSLCRVQSVVDYLHGPFALVSAALVLVSAATTYLSVARRWDEAHMAAPAPPAPTELDV